MSRRSYTNHSYCLNCGEELKGRYCYQCGQDSEDHQESVWYLVRHFFEDITHYDGNLWKTVKPLLTRPGFLTLEFQKGKRASYLNPVRMFIFLNFVFFLLLLSLPSVHHKSQKNQIIMVQQDPEVDSAINAVKFGSVSVRSNSNFTSSAEYDSAQKTLSPERRDGIFSRIIIEKSIDVVQTIKKDPDSMGEKATEIFLHHSAKLTFVFLIVCSCLLWVLYYRRHILLINHALFSIHLTCTFLLLSILMLLTGYLPLGGYIFMLIFLYGNYYFYKALRQVYQQSRTRTAMKFIIINFFLLIAMSLGLLINGLFALMSV